MLTPLRYTSIATPLLGQVYIAHRDTAVCCVAFGSTGRGFERICVQLFGIRPIQDLRRPDDMATQVLNHLTGRRRFCGRIDLSRLTLFQRRVLRKVQTIPAGVVRSYRWVAQAIGTPRAARAVGSALAKNPVPLLIPCHRVIRSDGRLGEYSAGGPSVKAKLLALEGMDLKSLTHPRNRRKTTAIRRRKNAADCPVSVA
jgi:methylated-DNA-[protein]-cysteine S-methyltransferase